MIQAVEKQQKQQGTIAFQGFPLGENTSVPPLLLKPQELERCIDFKFNPGGQLETRPGIVKYTAAAVEEIRDVQTCVLDGEYHELIAEGNATDGYNIHYLSTTAGGSPTPFSIGAIEGEGQITPYNNVAIISDGSYLKYCDDTDDVKIAYDAGPDGTFFDNYEGENDGTTAITTSGVGCTFTTPAWDTDYTIPPTSVEFFVQATTAGTATIECAFLTTAGTEVASASYVGDIPTTAPDYLEIAYLAADVTTELAPSTKYYCVLKGANVNLSHTTVTSGGTLVTAGGGTADTTKTPLMRVHPGLPPKSDWSVVSGTRLFVHDPDYPGAMYYGNLTHLDWSTSDGGGYITTVDSSRTSFAIGGAQDLYGELYVYGTQNQPFLCKLTGSTPSAYSLPLLFQRIWCTSKTIQNTGSDIWNASKDGADALSGVQEYGDLRTFSASDPIKDQIRDNWVAGTFTGYNPADGQYWLFMPGYTYVNICHTKQPIRDQAGQVRYPWSRYSLPCTPTCFSQTGEGFLIGSSDGFVYKLDPDEYKDLETTQIYPEFRTARIDMPARYFNFTMIQFAGHSLGGAGFNFDAYVDGNALTSLNTWPFTFPMSDSLTVDELTMDIDDMLYAIAPGQSPMYQQVNFNAVSVQFGISNLFIAGHPVFFDGIFITYRALEQ